MIKAKIKLNDRYWEERKQIDIEREKLITELLPLKPMKRAKSQQLKKLREELANEQKNVCFGKLCNGIIQSIDIFAKNRHECKKCYNQCVYNSYKCNNGMSGQRTKYLLKFGKSCEQCGCTDQLMLDFDHLDQNNKIDTIAKLNSSKKILEEVTKTRILCAFCHRLHTRTQIGNTIATKNKDFVDGIKLSIGQCQMCERSVTLGTTCCFDFDHINPNEKLMNVSRMIGNHSSFEKIIDEVSKCQLLCSNCHRKKTAEQFNYPEHHKIKIKLKKEVLPSLQCVDCGIKISRSAYRCDPCQKKTTRFVENRPSLEQIMKDKEELGTNVKVGHKYGVSEACIRKWIKQYLKQSNS